MNRVAFFLRHVLRDTWIAMLGLMCALGVDATRPRGTCGTHAEFIAVPLYFGAPVLCALGVGLALSHMGRRRPTERIVAVLVNAYTCAVSLYLSLPYTEDLGWPL